MGANSLCHRNVSNYLTKYKNQLNLTLAPKLICLGSLAPRFPLLVPANFPLPWLPLLPPLPRSSGMFLELVRIGAFCGCHRLSSVALLLADLCKLLAASESGSLTGSSATPPDTLAAQFYNAQKACTQLIWHLYFTSAASIKILVKCKLPWMPSYFLTFL